jgi:hypothetical protein
MFQYATARQLARRSGCALVLALSGDAIPGSHAIYRLRQFNIIGRDVELYELEAADMSRSQRALRRLRTELMLPENPIRLIEEKAVKSFIMPPEAGELMKTGCSLFEPALLTPQKNVRLFGYWQNERYFAGIASIIRAEFTLKHDLDPRSQACLAMIKSGASVFLHVRRGDYLEAKHIDLMGLCPVDYYQTGLALLRQRHGENLHVFVFSDDFEWVRANKIGGEQATLVDWNGDAPQNDLMLMRACQHAIIANSTFGWWGAWLGEWPGQTVIAPKIWYKAIPQYQDIVPERWIRL